ncbi:hypothetical protein [Burkholderia diffusa]|uniref:hypothetical protein n=1 Tax=Burkholderia diffusa TaxID=488732 RepID=UPI0012DA9B02|nr:hypothetical protein [Burkholderia diffusa]
MSNALMPLKMLADLMDQLRELNKRIDGRSKPVKTCQRIAQIEGLSSKTAIAIVAAASDPKGSETGVTLQPGSRVPRQTSRGERTRLLGISMQGGRHLRTSLTPAESQQDPRSIERRHPRPLTKIRLPIATASPDNKSITIDCFRQNSPCNIAEKYRSCLVFTYNISCSSA